jgi:photoactive yellow protein
MLQMPTPAQSLDDGFATVTAARLHAADPAWIDALPFGVIGFAQDGVVALYNLTESRQSGLSHARVIGRDFFADIGICMNNYLVAQRFVDEACLDETIEYVLTLRMRPTRVKLRMLKHPDAALSYILIQR